MRAKHGQKCLGSLIFAVFVLSGICPAADWPMWRHDASRRGTSPENLPQELHLHWTRKLPPVQLAWPNEPRLHFDSSYEPVVMGKTIFLASPNHGSVSAFDTETGQERWRFYAEGPVRFAPVAWDGKVYCGSDDGFLYCLRASDGSLLWKVRGAPADRPDRGHLGNGRLVSFWPVRGGPVFADGVIYFAAGIWPTMGVSVVAVDAQDGKVRWRNDRVQLVDNTRIDHNLIHDVGFSPQGYLLVAGNKLLVPNGRSMPAALDRETGHLLWYCQGYRNGDCRVTATDTYAFVGESGVVRLEDGREVGSRWKHAGPDAPRAFDARKFHLFEGPILPYKLFPACNARSALQETTAYGSQAGIFYAYQLHNTSLTEYE
ncbi:MAG: hypothetical protein FJ279_16560, partial [Planctomycetes bacterium]|nr:hypothetical protein [Planctomycetota bacterium]